MGPMEGRFGYQAMVFYGMLQRIFKDSRFKYFPLVGVIQRLFEWIL
jgi:hypothetical protein